MSLVTEEKFAIMERVTGMGMWVDLRDWVALENCYDEQIMFDYRSLFGGDKLILPRTQLIAHMQTLLAWWDATQHLITNVQASVVHEVGEARTLVRGTHCKGKSQWVAGGHYSFKLRRTSAATWVITEQAVKVLYEEDRDSIKSEWLQSLK